jgi:hypothetical protein
MPKEDAVFLVPRRHATMDGPVSEEANRKLDWFDSWHQAQGSAYDDPDWTLAAAIKWIAARTRDAVDRASLDEFAAQQAVVSFKTLSLLERSG